VGAISLFLNIAGAIAPVAPVLNTPLHSTRLTFAINFVHLALKLMQLLIISIGSLGTRLTIATVFLHIALKLTQHVILGHIVLGLHLP
jgi:hypothetical protein